MPAAAMLTAVSVPTAEPAGEVPPPLVSRRTRDTVLLALRCLYPCKPQRLEGETLILQRTRRRQARDFSGVSPIPTRILTINLDLVAIAAIARSINIRGPRRDQLARKRQP
jgi:hypothetical protein